MTRLSVAAVLAVLCGEAVALRSLRVPLRHNRVLARPASTGSEDPKPIDYLSRAKPVQHVPSLEAMDEMMASASAPREGFPLGVPYCVLYLSTRSPRTANDFKELDCLAFCYPEVDFSAVVFEFPGGDEILDERNVRRGPAMEFIFQNQSVCLIEGEVEDLMPAAREALAAFGHRGDYVVEEQFFDIDMKVSDGNGTAVPLGWTRSKSSNEIISAKLGRQAMRLGVLPGWRIYSVDGAVIDDNAVYESILNDARENKKTTLPFRFKEVCVYPRAEFEARGPRKEPEAPSPERLKLKQDLEEMGETLDRKPVPVPTSELDEWVGLESAIIEHIQKAARGEVVEFPMFTSSYPDYEQIYAMQEDLSQWQNLDGPPADAVDAA